MLSAKVRAAAGGFDLSQELLIKIEEYLESIATSSKDQVRILKQTSDE